MVFDEPQRVMRRAPRAPRIVDDFYRGPDTAFTPTEFWFEPDPTRRRRIRFTPPLDKPFPYRAYTAIGATPSTFWLETTTTARRRRARPSSALLRESWNILYPFPVPPAPAPTPPTIRPLRVAQTIFARILWSHERSFPPIFPFNGENAYQMYVTNAAGVTAVATSGPIIALMFDLSAYLGPRETIAHAEVFLREAGGVDARPWTRVLRQPEIVPMKGRSRQGVRQYLANLMSDGHYVASIMARTADGRAAFYVAPFTAYGNVIGDNPGNYLLWDDGTIITDDYGVPLDGSSL